MHTQNGDAVPFLLYVLTFTMPRHRKIRLFSNNPKYSRSPWVNYVKLKQNPYVAIMSLPEGAMFMPWSCPAVKLHWHTTHDLGEGSTFGAKIPKVPKLPKVPTVPIKVPGDERDANGKIITRRRRASFAGAQQLSAKKAKAASTAGDKFDKNGKIVTRRRRASLAGATSLAGEKAASSATSFGAGILFGKISEYLKKARKGWQSDDSTGYMCGDIICDPALQKPLKAILLSCTLMTLMPPLPSSHVLPCIETAAANCI